MKSSPAHTLLLSFFLTTTVGIVLYTMYAAFHYSSNAVLGRDEANFIILSSQKILAATSLRELIEGFFPSHGQHTLLGMQLINMFTYFSFGALDRRVMNVIGVFILCLAALLLPGKRAKNKTELILLYATLFPLVLSPAHNACIVNASCTGNHYFGVAGSIMALYFFTKTAETIKFFVCAEIFMLLAIFSLPAALALIPVSFLVLSKTEIKNKFNIIGVHLAFIVLMLAFHTYLTYPNTIFSFMQNTDATSLSHSIGDVLMFVVTFFIILGSPFYWLVDSGHTWVVLVAGVIIFGLISVTFVKTYKSSDKNAYSFPFYGVLLFAGMILIICFGRYYSFGSSRYSVYAVFLCAMLLMFFYRRAPEIKILFLSSAVSLIYFLTALHYHQQYLLDWEQKDTTCRNMWHAEGYACGVMITHEEATQIIKSAIDQGIYFVEK